MTDPDIDYAELERRLTTDNPDFPRRGILDDQASMLALTPTLRLEQNWPKMSYLHRIYRPPRR